MANVNVFLGFVLAIGTAMSCAAQERSGLWNSYATSFMDDQIRVIDRDDRDRTTSEAQAYGMFFALVANDRERFDRLPGWTGPPATMTRTWRSSRSASRSGSCGSMLEVG